MAVSIKNVDLMIDKSTTYSPNVASNDYDVTDGTPPVLDLLAMYSKKNLNLREELDRIVRDAGFGSLSTINYLTLKGFNYLRHGQQQVRSNRDNMGYTFFTRPILNLTYDNLGASAHMTQFRNPEPLSIPAYVRATLDPWGQMGKYTSEQLKESDYKDSAVNNTYCPLVDKANPFIPLLSNTLISLTGWKDLSINDYTSPAGTHNEQYGHADGFFYITGSFELSSSFRNIEGDPVSLMIQTWIHYIIACRQEYEMNPYPVFVEDREFDYNTRIYRFIMDHTRTYIQKYAATIAFPMSLPYGAQLNYSSDKNFVDTNAEIPVTWKCFGQDVNDPVLFYEFNQLVAYYEPNLSIDYTKYDSVNDSLVLRYPGSYVKLKPHEKNSGLFMAIPLINFISSELEWWISKENYELYVKKPEVKASGNTQTVRPSYILNDAI